jgi:hypothetical protein
MSWVADLANRQPELGPGSTQTASTASRSATVRNRGIIQRF